ILGAKGPVLEGGGQRLGQGDHDGTAGGARQAGGHSLATGAERQAVESLPRDVGNGTARQVGGDRRAGVGDDVTDEVEGRGLVHGYQRAFSCARAGDGESSSSGGSTIMQASRLPRRPGEALRQWTP